MFQLNNIKININQLKSTDTDSEISTLINIISKNLKINKDRILSFEIRKRSLDCRKKPDLFWLYTVSFSISNLKDEIAFIKKCHNKDLIVLNDKKFEYLKINKTINDNPVIIGAGPAGLFAAIYFVKAGLKPIIIERGSKIEERERIVNDFWNGSSLNTECNVQFGEGGAGTFSDGKLNTGVKDKYGRIHEVLALFHEFGAKENILYSNKPHIGTDILRDVIINIRKYLENNGAIFYFNTRLDSIEIINNKIESIKLNNGSSIKTNKLVLAIGHSARDTFEMLKGKNVPMENKPFAVGFRVMHNQKLINISQYGVDSIDISDNFPAADYKVTAKTSSGRGVYSFCMCPGGYVVNASSENNRLCINGMSYNKRDSKTANSAIIITIDENDYGKNLLDGMYFQRKIEENAYKINNGSITIQKLEDFRNNKKSNDYGNTIVSVKGKYIAGSITDILPDYMNKDIIEAFDIFGHSINGFDKDALLCGIEARTSSPVRILRNDKYESSIKGLYPSGEGAGYAGGITSACVDGLKVAESIVFSYNSEDIY